MGQYFKIVNLDKQEVVCPFCLGIPGKLIEWTVNHQIGVLALLLRQSSATGGGDYGGHSTQIIDIPEEQANLAEVLAKSMIREGMKMPIPTSSVVGSWAGDRITMVTRMNCVASMTREC